MKKFDIIIIGSGAGSKVMRTALSQGYDIGYVEDGPMGGTCLNRGCIPTKILIHCADVVQTIKKADVFGGVSGIGSTGPSVSVTVPQMYIPEFASPDRLFYPSDPKTAMKYWRFFYGLDPVCGNIIDMYAEMMQSDVELVGEGVTDEMKDILYQTI